MAATVADRFSDTHVSTSMRFAAWCTSLLGGLVLVSTNQWSGVAHARTGTLVTMAKPRVVISRSTLQLQVTVEPTASDDAPVDDDSWHMVDVSGLEVIR